MKLVRVLLPSFFAIVLMIGLSSSVPITKDEPVLEKVTETQKSSAKLAITNKQFLQLTPNSYYQLTGIKMGFKDRMALKLAQQEIRSSIKKNTLKENDAVNFNQSMAGGRSSFRFGGFLLGLLLGLIGVGLAYIFTSNKDYIKSAWKGFATWVAIILLLRVV